MTFWPYWRTEDDLLELGDRLPPSDEPSTIEHRLAKANGLTYGCPPRHWAWERARLLGKQSASSAPERER